MELNPFQSRAVTTPGHLTVLACPGSGKTRVLSTRAAHLINSNEIGRLCAVTFTRDAANELRSRIVQSCGQEHARRLAIGTFHSLALEQERRVNHGKMPRLINEGERHAILKGCWKSFAAKTTYEELLKEIDIAKTVIDGHVFENHGIELAFRAYEQALAADNMMDFSDILLRSARGMRDGHIPPLPCKWLLVDESQDMDLIQKEWILSHAGNGTEVTLVGDDDQSLYSFRMALGYKGLVAVSTALNSVELTLPVNYRCAPNILDHAAKLIRHNQDRANKNIKAHKEVNGEIIVCRLATRHDETKSIGEKLNAYEVRGQWAVLARTNTMLDSVEMSLNSVGIPTKRSGGKSFWEHGIGAVVLALLRSLNANSWTGASQCLAHCGLSISWLSTFNTQRGDCMHKLGLALDSAPDDHARKKIHALREGIISWRYQADMGRVNLAICGVIDFVRDNSREGLKNMLDAVKANLTERGVKGSLAQRLERLQRAQGKEEEQDPETVHLITLHSSKGLEFDNVWIVGCEEGNLPHTDATEEEERRLMYVGMTRARSRLVISSAMEEGMESRFIEEAGL
ncbi:ATP-dependent helicase [Acidovorax sp. LjRoot129]|uniref:ATP-dependent helicase n=1 Tax=unclassified Acidovorax TaxID=2684926 RepID=UPI003ECCE30C